MDKYTRIKYMPPIGLRRDGSRVTLSDEHLAVSKEAALESIVLLKNEENILPLKGKKIALFGVYSYHTIPGGGGSGMVYSISKSLYEGLKEKSEGVCIFAPVAKKYNAYVTETLENAPLDYYTPVDSEAVVFSEEEYAEAAAFTDTAVYTIGRRSREMYDCGVEEGDAPYRLSQREKSDIEKLEAYFENIVIILNIGIVMDMEFYADKEKVKAIVLPWHLGSEGGAAMADVLVGDRTPAGKLVDTVARDYYAYPGSAEFDESEDYLNYSEDIYVGYRYFETIPGKADLVRYPFGYGLSYTTFSVGGILAGEHDGVVTVAATVTNTGKYSGKEVLQLYLMAPQGLLGKPKKELAAFVKTKLLLPGESQAVVLSFKMADMASYDDLGKIQKSAYILEKGKYSFFLGTSVREGSVLDFAIDLEENVVVKQVTSCCRPWKLEKRMLADGSYEPLPTGDAEYKYAPHAPLGGVAPQEPVLMDEVGKTISLADFVAQLTDDELVNMVGGHPPYGIIDTAFFGGAERLGIPDVPTADGPAGLRLMPCCHTKTTTFPAATALACSWNPSIVEIVGVCAAREVKENNFGIWLSPALNIHRDPQCGRNFEYYSEDPLIAGKMAAAAVRGVQSQKIATSIKHFCCNNKELNRRNCDSRVSERALREIYLKGFKICIEESDPWTLMTSYNLLNGQHTSVSYDLITTILREEWGFKGMVTSDWLCEGKHVLSIKAGNDMKMPYGFPDELKKALAEGELTRTDLEACAARIVTTYMKIG